MAGLSYYSTNNKNLKVDFQTALLEGLASDYGLYMISRSEIPQLTAQQITSMKQLSYSEIAFLVLQSFLKTEIPAADLKQLLTEAYNETIIPTKIEQVTGKTNIMWLTGGPTYSFKDYAARFCSRAINYFLQKKQEIKTVIVATSGDTGGAVAAAIHKLDNLNNIVFYPENSISEGQRRQMTTLADNIYAFSVKGDFDVCQALAKTLLADKQFSQGIFGRPDHFTSANSISLGRLLPQAIYPFYAYSRLATYPEPLIASIPSGNFGDMMGTVIAKQMCLPISKIICGVNANLTFPKYLETGQYSVEASKKSPSSAMIVAHPSNLARLIDFYGGHMFDQRDPQTNKVIKPGVIDQQPDLAAMRQDLYSVGISNSDHYKTMKDVYNKYKVILDPHGAVGWQSLDTYLHGQHNQLAVMYETADPGKFPVDVQKAIGLIPQLPAGMQSQAKLAERIYNINSQPETTEQGLKLSDAQLQETKDKIKQIF